MQFIREQALFFYVIAVPLLMESSKVQSKHRRLDYPRALAKQQVGFGLFVFSLSSKLRRQQDRQQESRFNNQAATRTNKNRCCGVNVDHHVDRDDLVIKKCGVKLFIRFYLG
jgi:hypothetical protein